MAGVVLKDVCKIYEGGVMAVDYFNLTISDREFVVLVGPSGCGKSTTLRMIAGLEDITSGDLLIGGRRVNDVQPKDRDIAMVFQNYALYPHMSVYDNMAFGLKIRKFSKEKIKERVDEAAEMLHLKELLQRKPKALSGGQRQRVAVGRAIVRHPQVFLFDEPLSNLDAKLRVQMRTEISSLHNRLQATMVYVTHDQVEAMTMGDRIVVMRDGVIQQVGTPLELYNRPGNRFVATFIGSPPMNIFSGLVKLEGEAISIKAQQLSVQLPLSEFGYLRGYKDREIFVGIRPEDVAFKPFPGEYQATIRGRVEVVEPLGAETHVYLTADDHRLIMRTTPDSQIKVGEEFNCYFDQNKLAFFDLESEKVIRPES